MSIRVKVANGVLVPLDPLPAEWREGEQFPIERNGNLEEVAPADLDDSYWKELDRLAAEIDTEDWNRMQAALDEHRREAKEWMRRRMGLS